MPLVMVVLAVPESLAAVTMTLVPAVAAAVCLSLLRTLPVAVVPVATPASVAVPESALGKGSLVPVP